MYRWESSLSSIIIQNVEKAPENRLSHVNSSCRPNIPENVDSGNVPVSWLLLRSRYLINREPNSMHQTRLIGRMGSGYATYVSAVNTDNESGIVPSSLFSGSASDLIVTVVP